MNEKERKKKNPLANTRTAKNTLGPIVAPISLVTVLVLYLLFRNNLADYGYLIILGPMVISLIVALVILVPKRNDPNYRIYYLFHPTRFIKVGVVVGIVLSLILYFISQCRASYGFSTGGIECINNLLSTPSSFFGN